MADRKITITDIVTKAGMPGQRIVVRVDNWSQQQLMDRVCDDRGEFAIITGPDRKQDDGTPLYNNSTVELMPIHVTVNLDDHIGLYKRFTVSERSHGQTQINKNPNTK